jgi:hypothetical protein
MMYYKLFGKDGVQVNIYDDTFDVAVRAAQMTFAYTKVVAIWIDHGVPKRLMVVDKPNEEKSWVSMLEG